jgi:DNA polymerase-3 subunit epsilon/CBS domain-containing protein
MSATNHSTPLVGLDAAVLDTETTGLDSTTARIVQIGVMRLVKGSLEVEPKFERLVDPGIPIPPEASAIHAITDQKVKGAPPFGAVIDDLEAYIGSSILIGHNIGYDLAVLRAEYERAGRAWRPKRALDVRGLARLAAPTLAHYGLRHLCEWLDIKCDPQGAAPNDAKSTARIFEALLPMLRAKNVRTLAEAEAALRTLNEAQADQSLGWHEGLTPASDQGRSLARIDSYPYRHRVRDVMSAPPVTAPADATVRDAIRILLERKVSSLYVTDSAGETGIVTERDVLRALHAGQEQGFSRPLAEVMSKPLHTIYEGAFLYRAIGRIERLGIRHLAVRDGTGAIIGAVTTRNLLRQRATTAIMLGDEIDSAPDTATLGRAWAKLALMTKGLIEEEVDPRTIAAVISSEICVLTRRATQLAEAAMAADGWGAAPCRYAVLVLGSAGRGESLLAADQDNAIVYDTGEPGGTEDLWFEELGKRLADILDAVGVPYCKGGVMAKNAQWRMSHARWKETINGWVRRQRPEDLLNVDIFFDGVPVYGDFVLGESIWHHAYDVGHRAPDFLKLLSELARQWHAPITLFGGIKVDDSGRADLKKGGLMPMFTGARVLSIRHDVRTRSTPDRLRAVVAKGIGSAAEVDKVIDAHKLILGAMLAQQLADTEQGVPLSPRVDPERLGKIGKAELKQALQQAETVVDMVGEGRL